MTITWRNTHKIPSANKYSKVGSPLFYPANNSCCQFKKFQYMYLMIFSVAGT